MCAHSMRSFCATLEYSSRRFPFRYLNVLSFGRQTEGNRACVKSHGKMHSEYVTYSYRTTDINEHT